MLQVGLVWLPTSWQVLSQALEQSYDYPSASEWPWSIPNNQYQATASQVFVDCCEKYVGKCDKNSVITINIYTNVKFKILVVMRVENIVVLPSVFLYISSYMK